MTDEIDLYEAADETKGINAYLDRMKEEKRRKRAAKARKRVLGDYTEAEIQRAIIQTLEIMGYMVIRVNSSTTQTEHGTRLSAYRVTNINATSGHADLVVYKSGRAWFLEVKRPNGRQSENQKRFMECCTRYGMAYGIATCPDDAIRIVTAGVAL